MKKDVYEQIAKNWIQKREKLGDIGSLSGHLSFKSYKLKSINCILMENGNKKLSFSYTIFIETEFTYYPDNPAYDYEYDIQLLLDSDDNIIKKLSS